MLKRLIKAWKLSGKDLTDKEIEALPNIGDGKAAFFGAGTAQDFEDMKNEESGMKAWIDRLKQL